MNLARRRADGLLPTPPRTRSTRQKPTVVFVHGAGLDHSLVRPAEPLLRLPRAQRARARPARPWPHRRAAARHRRGDGRLGCPRARCPGHRPRRASSAIPWARWSRSSCAARHRRGRAHRVCIGIAYPMKVSEAFLEAARAQRLQPPSTWRRSGATRAGAARRQSRIPGMWMYGDTLARLERLAPGVLHTDLKACNDYASDFGAA